MSHRPHDLAEDFPGLAERIHEMRAQDAHFAKLVEQYQAANEAVHRAESRLDIITEEAETALRRQRAHLKDHIAWHLSHGTAYG
jgi:uncharacterized protein YdcH (DUF465 family)